MRVVQAKGEKGSLKWIQVAVNDRVDLLNREIRSACGLAVSDTIAWLSPLRDDEYAEYRDETFLERVSVSVPHKALRDFWPQRGPQWDALGRTIDGTIILIEAKANIPEVVSPPSGASGVSKALIQESLRETQKFLGVNTGIDWSGKLYQYGNRIAHLYFLRELNQVPAYMVFVYFLGDKEVDGPSTVPEWKAALSVVKGVLGLGQRHRLSKYMAEIFIDVELLKATA